MKTFEVWHECIHSLCSYSDIKNGFHIRGVKRLNFLVKTSQSCSALCDPWTVACQPPPSMEFSRQKHWSALPSPSPGDLPNPGIKPGSPGSLGSIPGFWRSLGEVNGDPLQYSCLENFMDRGTWWATYSPWGQKVLDTTERLTLLLVQFCAGGKFHTDLSGSSLNLQPVEKMEGCPRWPGEAQRRAGAFLCGSRPGCFPEGSGLSWQLLVMNLQGWGCYF